MLGTRNAEVHGTGLSPRSLTLQEQQQRTVQSRSCAPSTVAMLPRCPLCLWSISRGFHLAHFDSLRKPTGPVFKKYF